MKAKSSILLVTLILFSAVYALQAQEMPAPEPIAKPSVSKGTSAGLASHQAIYYRLDFEIREMEGKKPIDIRSYSLWLQSGAEEHITAGSEVPYSDGTAKSVSFRSLGVSIRSIVEEGNDGPWLDLSLSISDALPPERDSGMPVIRNIRLNSKALLILGKPTTVGIVEDPGSRNRYQVDVTAIKLN